MKYEMQTHMVDLLLRQDRMTMAHSLEGRVPFLDRNFIAFIRSLPSSALVGDKLRLRDRRMHNTKILLKSRSLELGIVLAQIVARKVTGLGNLAG